ncbi:hypothetical protein [Pseudomonas multiresinivorans]|uniref:Uncharacterized protein n=1 Tax=Pseudomonas multiresinivorans TaxID=95301 RepID=A0A7Z3BK58_9PSED|nr:hypothetical protein [Pseudomonas multiresinivorans]QJP08379.1 hypothetical protein G4G71_11020 [Pseudomonas multiresinivorans]
MTRREFLDSLTVGDRVNIDMGSRGLVPAKIIKSSPGLLHVKFGSEVRRFVRKDGGTLYSPSSSKSWLVPMEVAHV